MYLVLLLSFICLVSSDAVDITKTYCIQASTSICGYQACTVETPTTTCPVYTYSGGCVVDDPQISYTDVTAPGSVYPNCTLAGFPSDMCQSNCLLSTPPVGCTGTTQYCQKYNCSGQFSCSCNLFNLTTVANIIVGGTNYAYNLSWYPCGLIQSSTSNYTNVLSRRALNVNNIFVSFEEPNVLIQNPDNSLLIITIRKDDYQNLYSSDQSFLSYPIPGQYLVASGTIYVDIFRDSVLVSSTSYDFVGVTTCRIKSCIVCWDAVSNYHCLPTIYKAVVIGIIVLIALAVLAFLPPVLMLLTYITKCVFVPTWWVLKTSANTWNKKVRLGDRLKGAYERFDSVNGSEPTAAPPRRGLGPARRGANGQLIVVLAMLTVMANGLCITSGTVASTLTNCVVGGSACPSGSGSLCKSCTVSLSIQSTVPIVGGSACYEIRDQNNTLRGTLEVKYNYLLQRVSLSKNYHTSAFTTLTQSVKKCYDPVGSSSVCKQNSCSSLSGDRTAYGTLTIPDVISRPGKSRCDTGCGCAACGCFYCQSSCLFSGYGIIPFGSVYEVDTYSTVSFIPSVTFNMTDEFGVSTVFTTEVTGVQTTIGNVTFLTLGTYQNSLQLFGSNSVVWNSSTSAWLSPAALLNSPTAGQIGDIQANSATSLSTISPTAFNFDPAIMTVQLSGTTVSYVQTSNGINNLAGLGKKFPQVLGGTMWTFAPGSITGNMTNPGALVTQITVAGNRQLAISTAAVCPTFSVLVASGCYSCVTGSAIIISAKSTCYSGAASITSSDPNVIVNTPAVILTGTLQNFTIYINTGVASNSFNLTMSASTTESHLVQFTAIVDNTVGNSTDTNTNTTTTQDGWFDSFSSFFTNLGDAISGFFEDVFTGVGSWWEYIILAVIIIGVAVGGFFGLKAVYMVVKTRGYMRMKPKTG